MGTSEPRTKHPWTALAPLLFSETQRSPRAGRVSPCQGMPVRVMAPINPDRERRLLATRERACVRWYGASGVGCNRRGPQVRLLCLRADYFMGVRTVWGPSTLCRPAGENHLAARRLYTGGNAARAWLKVPAAAFVECRRVRLPTSPLARRPRRHPLQRDDRRRVGKNGATMTRIAWD